MKEQIKSARVAKGWSQAELADVTGLSLRTIQRIETGKSQPRGNTLNRLCGALEIATIPQTLNDSFEAKLLCFSQFGFLLFPLLSLIAPIVVWLTQSQGNSRVRAIGKKIIQFQLFWNLLFWSTLFFLVWMKVAHLNVTPSLSFLLSTVAFFYLFNTSIILRNYFAWQKGSF